MSNSPSSDNYTLGKGRLLINEKKSGAYQGFREIGNASAMTFSLEISKLDHYQSMSGIKSKDKSLVNEVTPKVEFTIDEITDKNFALAFMANGTAVSQTVSTGMTSLVTPIKSEVLYDIGTRKLTPITYLQYNTVSAGEMVIGDTVTGAGGAIGDISFVIQAAAATAGIIGLVDVTGVFVSGETITSDATTACTAKAVGSQVTTASTDILVVKSAATPTIYTAGTDYIVDMFAGQIRTIDTVDGGTITLNSELTCAFGRQAAKFTQISMLEVPDMEVQLKFISNNPAGKNYDFTAWKVSLQPAGAVGFISDEWMSLPFTGEILKDPDHPTEPFVRFVMEV